MNGIKSRGRIMIIGPGVADFTVATHKCAIAGFTEILVCKQDILQVLKSTQEFFDAEIWPGHSNSAGGCRHVPELAALIKKFQPDLDP